MIVDSPTRAPIPDGAPDPRPIMVEAGHYTLSSRGNDAETEAVDVPGAGRWRGATSETTRRCFALAAEEVRRLRAAGSPARLGLMVGDLALPGGSRPTGASWAVPGSYRALLVERGLDADADVDVWGEAACRNLGRRRLLDVARHRNVPGAASYAAWGWALLRDADGIRLASDASLEWDGDVRAAVLTRGLAALCPLVFAGLKEAIFRADYRRHIAIYARADDPWIDVKLRAAAATVAQLRLGTVGEQMDRILAGSGWTDATWSAADLVAPGELDWPDFLAAVRSHHPGVIDLASALPNTAPETACPPSAPRPASRPTSACGATKTTSPCSG